MYCGKRKTAACLVAFVIVLTLYAVLKVPRVPATTTAWEMLTTTATEATTRSRHPSSKVASGGNPEDIQELSCLSGVVTVQPGGRLGNRIMEYASAWSFAKLRKLRVAMPKDILEPLGQVFQNLKAEPLEDLLKEPPCRSYNLTEEKVLKVATDNITRAARRKQLVVLRKYTVRIHDIVAKYEKLHEEFSYLPAIAEPGARTLVNIRDRMAQQAGTQHSKVLVVSVHVRRTDYPQYLQSRFKVMKLADVGFYRRAAARMRKLLEPEAKALAFVIASDDRDWCEKELLPELIKDFQEGTPASGAFLVPEEVSTRDHDLALLSIADNSIYAYGTYGSWGALMAGGRAIVFNLTSANPHVKPPPINTAMRFASSMKSWETLA